MLVLEDAVLDFQVSAPTKHILLKFLKIKFLKDVGVMYAISVGVLPNNSYPSWTNSVNSVLKLLNSKITK